VVVVVVVVLAMLMTSDWLRYSHAGYVMERMCHSPLIYCT